MATGDDELKVPLGFDVNTSNAEAGFQRISSLASQIREDFRLVNEAVEGITDKADRMREYFQGNLEVISSMKSLMEAINSINMSYQTTIGNNITLISELLNSVKGLNGDITHAMQLVNQASGAMGGGSVGGAVGLNNTTTSSMNFNPLAHNERRVEPISPLDDGYLRGVNGPGDTSGPSVLKTPRDNEQVQPQNPLPPVSGGSAPPSPPRPPRPPIAGPGSPAPGGGGGWRKLFRRNQSQPVQQPMGNPNDSQVTGEDEQYGGEPRPVRTTVEQIELQRYLQQHANNLYMRTQGISPIPVGGEHKAAEYAYTNLLRQMGTVANILPGNVGKQMMAHAQAALYNYGNATLGTPLDLQSIKNAQKQTTRPVLDSNGNPMMRTVIDANGNAQQIPIVERTGGYTPIEQAALHIANTVSKVMHSNFGQAATKAAGYIGLAKNVYSMATAIPDYLRQYASNAQTSGGVYGTVSYTRSAGNYLTALADAGFGFNPLISTQQVQQMQLQGAALGLRGGNLNSYVNQAINNQTQFGMSGAATQNLTNTALGAGISVNDIMNANAQVRQMEAGTQTSTTYGQMALATGATGAAAMGASSAAAAQVGVQAANFGKNDFIAQSYGMTGQEGTGTMLNNALMAQALGTTYTGLFAAERKAGGLAISAAQNKTDEEILTWAGIDTTSEYKDKTDFLNKNQNQMMILSMILSDPSMGSKLNNIGSNPQASADWAWNVLKAHKSIKAQQKTDALKNKLKITNKAYNDSMSGKSAFPTDSRFKAIAQKNQNEAFKEIQDAMNHPGTEKTSALQAAEKAYKNADFIGAMTDLQNGAIKTPPKGSGSTSSSDNNGSLLNNFPALPKIEINLHPDAKKLITAAVKNGTVGFNSGQVPPNKQPTRG